MKEDVITRQQMERQIPIEWSYDPGRVLEYFCPL